MFEVLLRYSYFWRFFVADVPRAGLGTGLVSMYIVVALGKKNAVGSSYWGSNWLDNETHDGRKLKLKSNNTAGQLTVMAGPSSSAASGRASSSSSDTNNKKTGGGTTDAQVVPLTRASGSRVAKILEGSN